MAQPKIDSFRFGTIMIDGNAYRKDIIILPDRVLPNWWRVEGHSLAYEDLQQALRKTPQVLILGLGIYSRIKVSDEVRERIESSGITLMALPSVEACEVYNQLREQKHVVAAIHLTC
jgi:hypothetical protein